MKKALVSAANAGKGRVGIELRQHFPPHDIKNSWRLQEMTEREFYYNGIKELLEDCQDVGLLDYIYRLLCRFMKK